VLVGHPTYYPRFGYRTRAYGPAEVFVPRPETPAESLEMRPPGPDDVPALVSLWREDQAEVDFSIEPDVEFLAWVSPNPNITATVYLRDGEIVGYTRSHGAEANRLRYFLARDGETAQSMAATLVQGFTEGDTLLVPVHPASKAAQGLPEGTTTTWNAAMACELLPSRLDEYFTLVEEGKRPPGTVIWPVEFDLE
jgi:hypothetical protein